MKGWALGLVGMGSALLAALGFLAGSMVLGALGAALLIGWLAVIWLAETRLSTLLLPATAAVGAAVVLIDAGVLPVVAALTLVVMGWDVSNAFAATSAYPASERGPVLRAHLVRLLGLGIGSVALAAVSLSAHVHVGFRLALALALGSLLLLGGALRLAGPWRRGKTGEEKAER